MSRKIYIWRFSTADQNTVDGNPTKPFPFPFPSNFVTSLLSPLFVRHSRVLHEYRKKMKFLHEYTIFTLITISTLEYIIHIIKIKMNYHVITHYNEFSKYDIKV